MRAIVFFALSIRPAEASLAAVRSAHQALNRLGSPGQAPSATYVSTVVTGDARGAVLDEASSSWPARW